MGGARSLRDRRPPPRNAGWQARQRAAFRPPVSHCHSPAVAWPSPLNRSDRQSASGNLLGITMPPGYSACQVRTAQPLDYNVLEQPISGEKTEGRGGAHARRRPRLTSRRALDGASGMPSGMVHLRRSISRVDEATSGRSWSRPLRAAARLRCLADQGAVDPSPRGSCRCTDVLAVDGSLQVGMARRRRNGEVRPPGRPACGGAWSPTSAGRSGCLLGVAQRRRGGVMPIAARLATSTWSPGSISSSRSKHRSASASRSWSRWQHPRPRIALR